MAGPSPFKSDILTGRVALITGGGSGIGYEITRQLGLHGAKVVISGRRQQVLDGAAETLRKDGIEVRTVQGDVRKYESCESMVATAVSHFGSLSIVVNCAAGNFLALPEQLSSNGFRTVLEIDTLGTFNVCRAAFPALSKCASSNIINISATLQYGATWYQAHASAAKSAVDSLTRSLALEWGSFGVRVNGVAPGPIAGTAGMAKLAPGAEERMQAQMARAVPVGRMGERCEIAYACLYLASSAGSFVSGHTLVVDGGEWMHRTPLAPREAVAQLSRGVESKSRAVGVQSKM